LRELSPADFDGVRLKDAPGVVGVCFHARWCGFCRAFLPVLEAREPGLGFSLALADISSYGDPRWDLFGVRAVPTLLLFREGQLAWRRDGPLGIGLSERDIDPMVDAARELAR
jgi:thioredoxin 1